MTFQVELPDRLHNRLKRLVEAGYFRSREEAILKAAEQLLERLEPVGHSGVEKDQPQMEPPFRQNQTYFEQQKQAFQKRYEDQFIAIWEERVVDHDADRSRLADRVYKRFGYVPIYIDQPSKSPARFRVPY